jgi:hypothetical protein
MTPLALFFAQQGRCLPSSVVARQLRIGGKDE